MQRPVVGRLVRLQVVHGRARHAYTPALQLCFRLHNVTQHGVAAYSLISSCLDQIGSKSTSLLKDLLGVSRFLALAALVSLHTAR
jgi:hypothetical protein